MICIKCKSDKPESEFVYRNKSRGIRRGLCKCCKKEHTKEEYVPCSRVSNKSTGRTYKKDVAKLQRMKDKLRYLELLSKSSCIDCGTNDIRVLEFDHVIPIHDRYDPTVRRVSKLVCSKKKMLDEISKCVVRCANCHTIKTFEQMGWSRDILSLTEQIKNYKIMPTNYSTPGVPEPEVSAMEQIKKTGAFPDDTNWSNPARYDQCVEAPGPCEPQVMGQGPAYTD